ncbi:hypothetical protein GALL_532830 [mine drainage metagenome]|uniref:Uncharacterized protein n=1 Tax=mine drainage metagenome TaxID=410659 RepID=A0A1J5P3B8_9ZZZZ
MGDGVFVVTVEKCGFAAVGIVDDLVGYDQRAGNKVGMDAADAGDGNDMGDVLILERPDVRAVVDLVRRNSMAVAMARKKNHFMPVDVAECKCT